jgi:hypothetical protein
LLLRRRGAATETVDEVEGGWTLAEVEVVEVEKDEEGTVGRWATADAERMARRRFWSLPSSRGESPSVLPLDMGGGFGRWAAALADLETEAIWEVDWERWRMACSEGFRRRSMLLLARWPGVWLRVTGTRLELDWGSEDSSDSSGMSKRSMEAAAAADFWDRRALDCTDEADLSVDLPESAMF